MSNLRGNSGTKNLVPGSNASHKEMTRHEANPSIPASRARGGRLGSLLAGWTPFERVWLASATLIITVVSVLMGENWLGFVSAISGILCVVLVAKGKIANYFFGIIQTLTYAYIAYTYQLFGEAMLNGLFFFPLQFVGLYLWNRHRKNPERADHGEDVYAKSLTRKQWAVLIPVIAAVSLAYALFLANIGAQQVRIDSVAVVVSVFAQILMILRYAEQWIMWIVVNVLTIALWVITLTSSGGGDWAIFVMWCAYLVNSTYGWVNWRRLSQEPENIEAATASEALAPASSRSTTAAAGGAAAGGTAQTL